MFKKIILIIVALLTVLSPLVIFVQPANAWTDTNLPQCSISNDAIIAIDSTVASDSRFDEEKTGLIIFERDWTGAPLYNSPAVGVVWDTSLPYSPNSGLGLSINPGVEDNFYLYASTGSGSANATAYRFNRSTGAVEGGGATELNGMFSDLKCVYTVINFPLYEGTTHVDNRLTQQEWVDLGGQEFFGFAPGDIDIYPKFAYNINQQGQVGVHYLSSNLIDNPQSQDCSLPGPPGSWRLKVDFHKGATLEDTRTISCLEPIFDFETSGLGDYSIEMQYISEDLELPPPYIFNPKFPIEGYSAVKSIINFSYNGFIMSGSNAQPQADCSLSGSTFSCDVQNEFNECDWADIGCHLSNFIIQLQIWLFNMLYAVFGIQPNQVPQIEQIFSFELDTHGLTSVVTAPLSVFNNLISSNYTCSSLNLPLPNLDNKNIVLPCLTPIYENHFSAGFIMYQTIITGIAFYYVTVSMLRHFKELTDPKKDSIEVTKL